MNAASVCSRTLALSTFSPKTLDLAARADHTSDVCHRLYRLHGGEEENFLDV